MLVTADDPGWTLGVLSLSWTSAGLTCPGEDWEVVWDCDDDSSLANAACMALTWPLLLDMDDVLIGTGTLAIVAKLGNAKRKMNQFTNQLLAIAPFQPKVNMGRRVSIAARPLPFSLPMTMPIRSPSSRATPEREMDEYANQIDDSLEQHERHCACMMLSRTAGRQKLQCTSVP